MSAAGKGKARCQLKNSNGEEFTAVFNGVPGKGLTFVLQELRSKDYLGNKEGVLSKSPYHWRITPDENGNLCGEWILRFDEDVKSVIAYSHQTFVITLYDAYKKELAKQRVAYSNFGTGLKKTFPDGSKPGAYLQRTEMSTADDEVEPLEGEENPDYSGSEFVKPREIDPEPDIVSISPVLETDTVPSIEENSEEYNKLDQLVRDDNEKDFIENELHTEPDLQNEINSGEENYKSSPNEENIIKNQGGKILKSIDENLLNKGDYREESGLALIIALGIIKYVMIPGVLIGILIIIMMVIEL